jgi:hypothetical protein
VAKSISRLRQPPHAGVCPTPEAPANLPLRPIEVSTDKPLLWTTELREEPLLEPEVLWRLVAERVAALQRGGSGGAGAQAAAAGV